MSLPGGGDVRPHGRGRAVRVPGGDRIDHAVVLPRADPVVGRGEVQAEEVQVRAEPDHGLVEHPVAGELREKVVEAGVLRGEGGDPRVPLGVGLRVREVGLRAEAVHIRRRGHRGGPAGRRRLQDEPHLDQLLELLAGEQRGGRVSGQGALADQPVGLQSGERLADGRGRDLELAGEGVDVDPGTGRDGVIHDQRLHRVVHVLGERQSPRRPHRRHDPVSYTMRER
ncbi:hypothetical protein Pflav_082850 [Phytohabitans flavus]|uniref:Uncharacterized protein n=1 Tax=Phytohabitans flavus TaxID=1076124 RepID=A0A6F8Y703_9ACTN|nr:hypothetical protein Pflav_082850 [Phytohabitans flavus]